MKLLVNQFPRYFCLCHISRRDTDRLKQRWFDWTRRQKGGFGRVGRFDDDSGIFTNNCYQFQEWAQLSALSKNMFTTLLYLCCHSGMQFNSIQKWKQYRTTMDALVNISFKHQASVESVVLKWLLQLNDGARISLGTELSIDFAEEQIFT